MRLPLGECRLEIGPDNHGPVVGKLTIEKLFKDGTFEVVLSEQQNLITRGGLNLLLANLFRPFGGEGDPLWTGKVGVGGTTDPAGLLVKVPTQDMTDLYSPVATTSIVQVNFDSINSSLTLAAYIDQSQANGLRITEAGFFSKSGVMFNIKTFTGIDKLNSFSLVLKWNIQIS